MRTILAICTAILILSAIPSSASGWMATCAGGPEAGAPTAVSPAEPSLPDFMVKPVLKTTCTVTRACDYPPPSSVSCTSASGNCSSGADGYAPYGYVQCDLVKTYCPPPPSCTVSCGSSVQCYSICQAGGQEPVTYQCLPSHHCCDCKY